MLALEQTHDARSKGIDGPLSLRAASAKIWIKEFDSDYRDLNADLAVKRWVDAVENGEGMKRSLVAPVARIFEVKGALINPYGHEVVPRFKIDRD
jgi:hypothetical protein